MPANTFVLTPLLLFPTVEAWLADMNARFAPNRYGQIDDADFRAVFSGMAQVFADWRHLSVKRVKGDTYPVPYTDNLNLVADNYRILGMQAVALNGTDSASAVAGAVAPPVYYTLLRFNAGDVDALLDVEPDTVLTAKAHWVRTSGTDEQKIATFPVLPLENVNVYAGEVYQYTFSNNVPVVTRLLEIRSDITSFTPPVPTGLDSDPYYKAFAPLSANASYDDAPLRDVLANHETRIHTLETSPAGGGGGAITSITYAALVAALAANAGAGSLTAGGQYLLSDYQTVFPIGAAGDLHTAAVEPLLLTALAPNSLAPVAYSPQFPSDILYYSPANGTADWPWATTGYLTRRIDTARANDLPLDFRTVQYRRWQRPQTPDEIANFFDPLFIITTDNGQPFQDLYLFEPGAYAAGNYYDNTFTRVAGQSPFNTFSTACSGTCYIYGNQLTGSVFSDNTLVHSTIANNVVTTGTLARNVGGYIVYNQVSYGSIADNDIAQGTIQFNVLQGSYTSISGNTLATTGYAIANNTLIGTSSIVNYTPDRPGQKKGNTAFDTPAIPFSSRGAGVFLRGRRVDLLTAAYGALTFYQDTEVLYPDTTTVTLSDVDKVVGTRVGACAPAGQPDIVIPATGFVLDSGAFVAGKAHVYTFLVRADGLIHYTIQSF